MSNQPDHWTVAAQTPWHSGLAADRILSAWLDVGLHAVCAPDRLGALAGEAALNGIDLAGYIASRIAAPGVEDVAPPAAADHRFADPAWSRWPFDLLARSWQLGATWWDHAIVGTAGASPHNREITAFWMRQIEAMLAPSNFPALNPQIGDRIAATGGQCLVDGARYLAEDMRRGATGLPPAGSEAFRVGDTVATAPGRVVYRNALAELIQYDPVTELVHPEPVLIVPAWIMKYYILDLSPHNSLVRWLTAQGFTVFMLSWHNPDDADAERAMDDYLAEGPFAALEAIRDITGAARVHLAGYCLGGTLAAIAAAARAREGSDEIASLTLFAAQTDFSEPGEIGVFIDERQVAALEEAMDTRGFLDGAQMGGAFKALRARELVWEHMVHTYFLGEREQLGDLMAWNADTTRMPAAMHAEYLERMFLRNELARGRYPVDGRPVALDAIAAPLFVVGTEKDHVAPWRSVFKIHRLTPAEVTFLLASGGHNAGVVSEPGHPHRHYRVAARAAGAPAPTPQDWLAHAEQHTGSWWPSWAAWLAARSGPLAPPPPSGPAIAPAPGAYVMER